MSNKKNISIPKTKFIKKEQITDAIYAELQNAGIVDKNIDTIEPYEVEVSSDGSSYAIVLMEGYDWVSTSPRDYRYISLKERSDNEAKVRKAIADILGSNYANKYNVFVSRTYNQALGTKGGDAGSWHMHGLAADISLKAGEGRKKAQAELADRFMKSDAKKVFPRLLVYTDTNHIHVTHVDGVKNVSSKLWSKKGRVTDQTLAQFLSAQGVTSGLSAAEDEEEPEEKEEAPKYAETEEAEEKLKADKQRQAIIDKYMEKKFQDLEIRRAYLINRRKVDRELVNLQVAEDKAKRELESFVVTLPNRLKAKFSADFRNAKEPEAEGTGADTTKRQDRKSELYRNYYTLAKAYSDARKARNDFVDENKALLAPENEIRENKLSDIIKQEVRKFLML